MPLFIKLERRMVTEYKNDSIFRTMRLYTTWFRVGEAPKTNVMEGDYFWCPTTDTYVGAKAPVPMWPDDFLDDACHDCGHKLREHDEDLSCCIANCSCVDFNAHRS